jgi:hypothetical protein
MYRADVAVACTSAVSTATVNLTIKYTDPSGTSQTFTGGTPAACTTLGSSSVLSFSLSFRAENATAIQYSVTTANTPAYQASVAVFQESAN